MQRLATMVLVAFGAGVFFVPGIVQAASDPILRDLKSPAAEDSAFPQLAADPKGGVFMTWIETLKDGAGHRLRISHRAEAGAWEAPTTVHEGKDFWRNWADFPGLGVFADGSVMVHWLARSGEGTYDYNVTARITRDAGRTWGDPFLVNTDGTRAEHGFVSFAATEKGMAVVWLDGRETRGGGHEGDHATMGGAMTLRFAEFLSDGTRVRESRLDARVCDCCQTAVVNTSKGLLAAYRDRSETEFRDISLVRPLAEKIAPWNFSKDGWKINACPVNGPALAARGDAVTAVWFTMAGGKPRVKAAVSRDGGDTFSPPLPIDAASPLGRVDAGILPSGASLITWLRRDRGGSGQIRGAFIDAAGVLQPSFTVAAASIARAAGFPRFEVAGEEVVFAWTEIESAPDGATAPPSSRARTAVMGLK